MTYGHNGGMHPLHEYLVKNNITQEEFARQVGCDQSHISKIISGERDVGSKVRKKIIKVTNGRLGPAELYPTQAKRSLTAHATESNKINGV